MEKAAQLAPTLKATGSNPAGYTIKEFLILQEKVRNSFLYSQIIFPAMMGIAEKRAGRRQGRSVIRTRPVICRADRPRGLRLMAACQNPCFDLQNMGFGDGLRGYPVSIPLS